MASKREKVKRWKWTDGNGSVPVADPLGKYVRYEDYFALLFEIEEMEGKCANWHKNASFAIAEQQRLRKENARLREKVRLTEECLRIIPEAPEGFPVGAVFCERCGACIYKAPAQSGEER